MGDPGLARMRSSNHSYLLVSTVAVLHLVVAVTS